jgi:hypothetical protein
MLLSALLVPAFSRAQTSAQTKPGPPAPPLDYTTKYQRSEQGLLTQLQLILTNAKDPEKDKLLVEELQMPKYDQYFQTIYRSDVEPFWEGSYTRALMGAVTDFQSVFARLGEQEGEFKIRRINDAPAPGSKLEQSLMAKLNGPVDVYAVNWRKRTATDDSKDELLGYYAYLGGRFHWFYMLNFPKTQEEAAKEAAKAAARSAAGKSKPSANGSSDSTPGKAPNSPSSPQPSPQQ